MPTDPITCYADGSGRGSAPLMRINSPMNMKLLMPFLIAGSAALITAPSTAQELRLSGGYNGSNVQEAGEEGWVGRGGYQFGADVKLGQRWFVEPGVHFLVRNLDYNYVTAPDVPAQEFKYTSQSLRVPLMFGRNLMDPASEPAFNISIMGGPSALIGLNTEMDQDELDVTTRSTQWYIGFAGELEIGFIFVNGGYDVAMSNVFDGDDFSTNPKVNFYHLAAGIRLKLAK